jgi:DNA-binding NtrC family response regulator
LNTINNIRKNRGLQQRISKLENEVQKKYDFQSSVIGNSSIMQKVTTLMSKALETNITVTITGETGTGKEVVAKAIHYNSTRKNKPFVAVNMGAIPEGLIESELFGFEKGAFTNAHTRRIGKFEEANGGTLFLDEIGDMDLAMQVKLLRALQEREITRIGGNNTVKIDCRIIVATHRNLQEEVKKGKFREDLFYRLFGLPIELPPLRDRDKDVLILAKHFVEQFCKENNMAAKSISADAQKKLMGYTFPGNVRELKSVMDLAVVMSNEHEIKGDDIMLSSFDALPEVISEDLTMREYELRILHTYLKRYDNDIKKVAEKLDIGQSTIYRMLKEK